LRDAAALAGHLAPAGSMFAFLAAHRAEVFPDAGLVRDYERLPAHHETIVYRSMIIIIMSRRLARHK